MRLLPLLQEMLVRFGGWMPFARAAEMLSATAHVSLSKATARRLTLTAGDALLEAEAVATEQLYRTPVPSSALPVAHQQISADGAFVPLTGGEWAEVKTVAIATLVQGKGDALRATDLSYLSRLADHTTFSHAATLETHRRATDKAQRVTAVVDGADWIQEFLDLQCPAATRIIDWGHSSGYVTRAAQALLSDPGAAADWRSARLNELMHGDPGDVLTALCEGLTGCRVGSEQEAVVSTSLVYLARRADQLQYRRFREAGLPIGSGIVESANKLVVEARLKGAGMRWRRDHVNPMLVLRNTICSGTRWAGTWQLLEQYRLRRCAEQAQEAHPLEPLPPPRPRRRRPAFRDFTLRPNRRRAKL